MRDEINLVNFDNKIPISLSVIRFDTIFRHMHSKVQLLLVLDGECDIHLEDTSYHAMPNDMIIINPHTFHHLISNKYCTIISMFIDQKNVGLDESEANTLTFNLNTMAQEQTKRHDQIRYLVYSIIKYNTMENVNSIYTNRAIAYSFFAQLINDFRVKAPIDETKRDAIDTFNEIGAWLTDHYKENISLNYISKKFHYSVSYLSRMCKAVSGKSFTSLYDTLRVNYSLNDLLLTNKTIEDIAENNGFENARSYVRAFNNIHQMNPSDYRKKNANLINPKAKLDKKIFKKKTLDKILSQYDAYGNLTNNAKEEARNIAEFSKIDFQGETKPLRFSGARILELNTAGDLFNEETHDEIKLAKKDMNFEYILAPHVLSSKTHLLNHDNDSHWNINYVYFDKMMQKIKDFDAKPYLIFEYDHNLLKPGEFFALLLQIVEYLDYNYQSTVNDMMIAFNFARTSSQDEFPILEKEYFYLYIDLYREFKRNFPKMKIGTPVFYRKDILNNDIYFKFIKECEKNEVNADFIPIRIVEDVQDDGFLTKDKDEMMHLIEYLKAHNGFFEDKICLQGVNFTNNETLLHDTLYSSSYYLKNYLDNYNDIIGYSKTSLLDRRMPSAYDANPFHGENGFFTYNSIKKSSYNAYVFISKLKKNILKKDKNYIATVDKNKIVILLNNYNHYSDLFALKEYFEITNLNRYNCFPKSTNIKFKFRIKNLYFTDAKVKISTIGKENGSSYDKWLQMGAMKNLNSEELESLKNLSEIYYEGREEIITNHNLIVDVDCNPLESKLVEIELLNKI